jgi:Raf kinase inhibitor-like YbhB/YbcL family protein
MTFVLTSPAFEAGAAIPRKFSCDGEDVSPPLEWADAPDDTAAMVLIVDDPDARGFVHWVLFDATGSQSGGLAEGLAESPDAPPQGTNDFRKLGWGGPCPPSGTHRYRFTLYALDQEIGLNGTPTADEIRAAMQGHVLGDAQLEATYTRNR